MKATTPALEGMRRIGIAALIPFAIAGCGGDDHDAICKSTSEGFPFLVSTAPPGTLLENEGNAFDGKLSTAASVTPSLGAGSATFNGASKTQNDSVAGVLLKLPPGQTTQVTITTYNDGARADSGTAGTQSDTSQTCPGVCESGSDGRTFFGIPTTGPFTQLEATIQVSGTTAATEVLELCGKE